MFKAVSALMVLMAAAVPSACASDCKKWVRDGAYSGDILGEKMGDNLDKKWCKQACKQDMPGCNAVNFEKAWKKCIFLRINTDSNAHHAPGLVAYKFCKKDDTPKCGTEWAPCCGGNQCGGKLVCEHNQCVPCGGLWNRCCPGSNCDNDRMNCERETDQCIACGDEWQPSCKYGAPCNMLNGMMLMPDAHDRSEFPQCTLLSD